MERKPITVQLIRVLNLLIPELQLKKIALKFLNRISLSKLITLRTIQLIKVEKATIQEQPILVQ